MTSHAAFHPGNTPGWFTGRASRFYDGFARRALRGLYRRIAEDVDQVARTGDSVLDVGTGPGVLPREIARLRTDLDLTGIDLSSDMVAAASRNLAPYADHARAQLGDVTDLPFADDSFDLIVTSFSLHHWDDPAAAVPELARVLRAGGRLAVYDMPHAPFQLLDETAIERGLFTGEPARHSVIRSGVPFLRCARHILTA